MIEFKFLKRVAIVCILSQYIILLGLFFSIIFSEKKIPPTKVEDKLITTAKVISVYDGDTVTVEVSKIVKVRFMGYNSPELKSKDNNERVAAEAARDYLKGMLPEGSEVELHIPIKDVLNQTFSFGRVLAEGFTDINQDGVSERISEEMIRTGHGKEFVK